MELVSTQLNTKLIAATAAAAKLLEVSDGGASGAAHRALARESLDKLRELDTRLVICTSHLVTDYDLYGDSGRCASDARDHYMRAISEEGVLDELNTIAEKIKEASDELPRTRGRAVTAALNKFYHTINYNMEDRARDEYMICDVCNVHMSSDYDHAELQCPQCGAIIRLMGTIYADSRMLTQDKAKPKNGQFNPNRHFQRWWTHILAREPEEEIGDPNDPDNLRGEKLIKQLDQLRKRRNKLLTQITVDDVRDMLRVLQRSSDRPITKLNHNVPLLMKKLTGIGPPNVSDEFSQRVEKLFNKVLEIGERTRDKDRMNRSYYPFYIYKIIDAITPEADYETRRILYYIYMQGDDTVINGDQHWERICRDLPGIKFAVTDKDKFQRYRPK
jgi:predicted RNA-binding Zn-ribbon protein involved in translation (DUF1610 family)